MGKYHINKTTGRVALCRARKNCPFGDLTEDHYASYEEAAKTYEKLMEDKVLPRPVVYDQLKEMDANDLAHGFLSLAKDRGLDAEELSDALEFASILHAGQRRQNRGRHDTTPYIEHPLRVAYRLLKLGVKDSDVVKASLLHDTVEDCAQNFVKNIQGREEVLDESEARSELSKFISDRYGQRVTSIVISVTNDHRPQDVAKNMSQEEKNIAYKTHLKDEIVDNEPALLVKYGDFMDNAGGLHHNDIPGRELRIKRMASKYQPCVELFINEFNKNLKLIDDEAQQKSIHNLKRANARLEGILDKYSDLPS